MLARTTRRGPRHPYMLLVPWSQLQLCASTKYRVLAMKPRSWYVVSVAQEARLPRDVGRIKFGLTFNLVYRLPLTLHKLIASPTCWTIQLASTSLLWSLNEWSPKWTRGAELAWGMVGFEDCRDHSQTWRHGVWRRFFAEKDNAARS